MSPDPDDLLPFSRLYSYFALGVGAAMTVEALVLLFRVDPDSGQPPSLLLVPIPCFLLGLGFSTLRKVTVVVRRLENQIGEVEKHSKRI